MNIAVVWRPLRCLPGQLLLQNSLQLSSSHSLHLLHFRWRISATSHLSFNWKVEQNLFSSISSTAVHIFYGFTGFETMSIVAGEMRNPEKNVPLRHSRFYQYCICSLPCWASLEQSPCLVVALCKPVHRRDAFVEMIGPIGAPLFLTSPHFNRHLNIGESIMVLVLRRAQQLKNSCQKGLGKTNSKNAPVIAIITSGIFSPSYLVICSFLKH